VTPVPPAAVAAAHRFGLDPATLAPLTGATGQTWSAGPHVLRLSTPARLDTEIAAMSAAATAVPVPSVLDRTVVAPDGGTGGETDGEVGRETGGEVGVVLLSRLPGRPAADPTLFDRTGAGAEAGDRELRRLAERGRACGRLHAALARVTAPPAVPAARDTAGTALAGRQLLHLDLHVLNVLVDDGNQVTGVLDWANTAAGRPELDRARSWTVLRHDPAVLALRGDAALTALLDGWAEEAGLDDLPESEPAAAAWACRYMLDDLAGRHRPAELAQVTGALRDAERRVATRAATRAVRRAP
jgi:Ser/Thr protein kinase RdoA (MazF antagonist)